MDCLPARGVKYLFPVQVKTFQPIYDGKDLIAQARTGTGKTFSFVLPLIEKLQSVSQDGRRGRAPKVTYYSKFNTKPFESDFVIALGTFVWNFFVGVCNTERFPQIRSYSVTDFAASL